MPGGRVVTGGLQFETKRSDALSVGMRGDEVLGVFYNAGQRHIAAFVPYRQPPFLALCGKRGHWTSTRETGNLCASCAENARLIQPQRSK